MTALRSGEYGRMDSYKGVFRFCGGQRKEMVEFWSDEKIVGGVFASIGAIREKEEHMNWIAPESTIQPVYEVLAGREVECFCFWRGNFAQGVRGIIDPFDPLNPYGPVSGPEDGMKFFNPKTTSGVTVMTGTTAATVNMSKVSGASIDDSDLHNQTIEDMKEMNPLYNAGVSAPYGSIFMTDEHDEEWFEVEPNVQGLYYDEAVDELSF